MRPLLFCVLGLLLCLSPRLMGEEKFMAPKGSDAAAGSHDHPWKTFAHALPLLKAGDTLIIQAGRYRERLVLENGGTEDGGYITLQGQPGAVISGEGVTGKNLILIENKSYVKIIGLELTASKGIRDGSAIRVTGHGSHIELRNNRIHEIRGKDAMGITVYGTSPSRPLERIIIDGNEIYDCDPARSEALTLNGNITDFEVTNNLVHDVNNIGIDLIGGEVSICSDATKVARNGICKGNKVWRCRSNYEGGYAAGIYVDGGKDIVVEGNIVSECDLGLEIGAENKAVVSSGITVKNNILFHNDKAGIVFGGFDKTAGRVQQCKIIDNTCYQNNRHKKDQNGELWIQFASGNEVSGNTFVSNGESPIVQVDAGGTMGNTLSNNRYYSPVGHAEAPFMWRDKDIEGFAAWQRVSAQDADSVFGAVEVALPVMGSVK
ncbi:MAG: Por secretion system C-terminal sorting protein [Verrucomicrobiaceae bacterium]|nr:Por secretion system C-terminal sorting protein [Verrucomicrobiaceae bacterium]